MLGFGSYSLVSESHPSELSVPSPEIRLILTLKQRREQVPGDQNIDRRSNSELEASLGDQSITDDEDHPSFRVLAI